MINVEIIDVYVDSSEKVLQHKLKDGMLSKDKYCYWTRKAQFSKVADLVCPKLSKNYVADKIRESATIYQIIGYPKAWVWMIRQPEDKDYVDDEYDVRLHFRINGVEIGYFKCFGANLHFTELWFHSEHFVRCDLSQNNKKEDGIPPTNKLVGILPKRL